MATEQCMEYLHRAGLPPASTRPMLLYLLRRPGITLAACLGSEVTRHLLFADSISQAFCLLAIRAKRILTSHCRIKEGTAHTVSPPTLHWALAGCKPVRLTGEGPTSAPSARHGRMHPRVTLSRRSVGNTALTPPIQPAPPFWYHCTR